VSVDAGRIRAIYRKELREYRRTSTIVATMMALPVGVATFPLLFVLSMPTSAAHTLQGDPLIVLLGIPALVPTTIAAYAVVGERTQGSLEPVLTTAIPGDELLLAKALAALLPSLVVSYGVFALFALITTVFAHPGVAAAVLSWQDVSVQILFTPLLAVLTIWIGIAVSTRTTDVRVAQQLAALAGLPILLVCYLVAFDVIPASIAVAVVLAVVLVVADLLGWRVVSVAFDRERLITSTR